MIYRHLMSSTYNHFLYLYINKAPVIIFTSQIIEIQQNNIKRVAFFHPFSYSAVEQPQTRINSRMSHNKSKVPNDNISQQLCASILLLSVISACCLCFIVKRNKKEDIHNQLKERRRFCYLIQHTHQKARFLKYYTRFKLGYQIRGILDELLQTNIHYNNQHIVLYLILWPLEYLCF